MADNYGSKSVGEYPLYGLYHHIQYATQHADSLSVFLATTQKNYKNYNINYENSSKQLKTVLGLGSCYSHYELSIRINFLMPRAVHLQARIFKTASALFRHQSRYLCRLQIQRYQRRIWPV